VQGEVSEEKIKSDFEHSALIRRGGGGASGDTSAAATTDSTSCGSLAASLGREGRRKSPPPPRRTSTVSDRSHGYDAPLPPSSAAAWAPEGKEEENTEAAEEKGGPTRHAWPPVASASHSASVSYRSSAFPMEKSTFVVSAIISEGKHARKVSDERNPPTDEEEEEEEDEIPFGASNGENQEEIHVSEQDR